MKKTFYLVESKGKLTELFNLLHLPYLAMNISFLVVGFSIHKPINWIVLVGAAIAYVAGLGIGAHFLDQIPGQGTRYVEYWNKNELMFVGVLSLIIAFGIGVYFTIAWGAYWMALLIPAQGFFAVAYPVARLFKGFFHNDISFAFSFGFVPVLIGYYANTLSFSWLIIPFGLLCFLIALIEITLSRYVRTRRKEASAGIATSASGSSDNEFIAKPEKALKLLCLLSYVFAGTMLLYHTTI